MKGRALFNVIYHVQLGQQNQNGRGLILHHRSLSRQDSPNPRDSAIQNN